LIMSIGDAIPKLANLLTRWFGAPVTSADTHRVQRQAEVGALAGFERDQPRSSSRASVVAAVIEAMLGVVDSLLARVPNPVPSSGQLRQARGRGSLTLASAFRRARRPLLAGIGTADLLAEQLLRGLNVQIDLSAEQRLSSDAVPGRRVSWTYQLGRGGPSPVVPAAQPILGRVGDVRMLKAAVGSPASIGPFPHHAEVGTASRTSRGWRLEQRSPSTTPPAGER
jgi:hypothetical protein